ncbi:hypothetical protein PFISCL1PPCAC_7035 [Pristionchus fissidentatus]|uniref:Uncharacterized protein n=1 Tax=Pristionchus fissidentatus TaxID=1538716 RepID=A0AAV5V938_9BILA|nr:hypothetical protein PFISCL1PPCAC_7035 [Pristionchus fissidentatus]
MIILLFCSLLGVCLAAPSGYSNEPSSSTVIPTTDVTTPASRYLQMLKGMEPKLREMLRSEIPEEGVNEYFELGFLYPPYNGAKHDSMLQWVEKWNISYKFSEFDTVYSVQSKVANRVSEVFRRIFVIAAKLASLATADSISTDQMDDLIATFRGLSPFEKKLLESVGKNMPRTEPDRDIIQLSPLFLLGLEYPQRYDGEISDEVARSASASKSVFQLLLKKLHFDVLKSMTADGVPEEAIHDFFESGLLNPPYNKGSFNSIKQWASKWKLPDRHGLFDKLDFELVQSFQRELAIHVLTVFDRLYAASLKLGEFAKDDNLTAEEIDELTDIGKTLSPFEQMLIKSVSDNIKEELKKDKD